MTDRTIPPLHLWKVWEETKQYAQDYGLEHYIDNLDDLNQKIMKLIKLQELLELANQRHLYKNNDVKEDSESVKQYSQGKFIMYFQGEKDFLDKAVKAFKFSVDVYALLDREKFRKLMKDSQVPKEIIEEYLKYFQVIDDSYSSDVTR